MKILNARMQGRNGWQNSADFAALRKAIRLAKRSYGMASPNPMVGAVLVEGGKHQTWLASVRAGGV